MANRKSSPLVTFSLVLLLVGSAAVGSAQHPVPPAPPQTPVTGEGIIQSLLAENMLGLVLREDVAQDVAYSDRQKTRIKSTFEETVAPPGGGRSLPGFVNDGMIRDMLRGKMAEVEGKILPILSSAQRNRIEQIRNQLRGAGYVYETGTRRTLKLTRDQNRALDALKRRHDGRRNGRSGVGAFSNEETKDAMAILTEEQRATLRTTLGKPFVASASPIFFVKVPELRR